LARSSPPQRGAVNDCRPRSPSSSHGKANHRTSRTGFLNRGSGAGDDKLRDRLAHLGAKLPQSRCLEVAGILPGEPVIPRGLASASDRFPTERDGESRPSNVISPSQARRARPLHPPSLFAHHSRLVGQLHQDGKYSLCPGSSSPARRSKKERAFGGAVTKALSLLGAEVSALCEYGRSTPTTCQTVTVK
jgi:hypothetical protein